MNTRRSIVPLLLSVILLIPVASGAHAPGDKGGDKTLSPYFVVSGGTPGVDGLPLKSTRADVQVSGVIARVKVTQTYSNDGKTPLEAIYVFPGSTRAAVFGMRMTIGKRVIEAEIQKRDAARKIYEAAKAAGKSASLLEQQRPNVFQMNVANIMPGDVIKVEMDYTELLEQKDGEYEFVYPAVVGPRYTEATAKTAGSHDKFTKTPYQRKGDAIPYAWDLNMKLAAGVPVGAVSSPSHKIDADIRGSHADINIADGEKAGDSDFVLRYVLRGEAIDTGLLLFADDDGGEKFFLTMVQPPKALDDVKVPSREYIFIVDVSGSMHGFPLNTAKSLLSDLFEGLRGQDRFNVMMFSGGSRMLAEQSVPATRQNLNAALNVVGGVSGGGGTRILPALRKALAMPAPEEMSRTFVVITDGFVSVEAEAFDLIRKHAGDANMFTFGIGTSVNRFLIEGMARVGMGEPFVALNARDATEKADKFKRYIASPALTNIQVKFRGFDAYDVEPASVPDLFAERPVVVFGKYRGAPRGKIEVTGITGAGRFKKTIDVASAPEDPNNDALKYLWARNRITRLADMNKLRRHDSRIKEVTELGLKYNLMTAYTSFVAVDSAVRNEGGDGTTVKQPLPLPKGVDERAVGNRRMRRFKVATGRSSTRGMGGMGAMRTRSYKPRPARAPMPVTQPAPEPSADAPEESAEKSPRYTWHSKGLTIRGALSRAQVRRMLPKLKSWLRRCIGSSKPMRLELRVKADGSIALLRIIGGRPAAAGKCLGGAQSQLRFPKSSGTTRVTFIL